MDAGQVLSQKAYWVEKALKTDRERFSFPYLSGIL
jgi:hypothetical protein